MSGPETRLQRLTEIYGADLATVVAPRLEARLAGEPTTAARRRWSHDDIWLITYADQFTETDTAPLATLHDVLDDELADVVTGVHVLPFCPWSSDDGFSVIDYHEVHEPYGTWTDIERLAADRPFMADAVINHLSASSPWFEAFLADAEPHRRFFRTEHPDTDTSAVVRPRTHPLLTGFDTTGGPRWVWTTFSADQVDLDYAEPDVLLAVVDVVLHYARRGASAIRLDAVGFCWKDPATSSIHRPETHAIVQLLADCLADTHPGTILITETNVPHEENVSYLHPTIPEAQAVYQFPLAPLSAHAIRTGDVDVLVEWAAVIDPLVAPGRSFFNFLASHDGIGLRPAEGLLGDDAIDELVRATEATGGRVNHRTTPGGGTAPYELNVTWFDLIGEGVDTDTAIARHLATHALLLALPGVAGVYVHALVGSSNDLAGVDASGINRRINRQKFDRNDLRSSLVDDTTVASRVLAGMRALVGERRTRPAFHPEGRCTVDQPAPGVVRVQRRHDGHDGTCTINFRGTTVEADGPLGPYEVRWS